MLRINPEVCDAIQNLSIEIIKDLLDKKADPNSCKMIYKDRKLIVSTSSLFLASQAERKDVVKLLLEYKADAKNNISHTFCHKYLLVKDENIDYLLELNGVIDLSNLFGFDNIAFNSLKHNKLSEIINSHITIEPLKKIIIEYC